MLLLSTDGGRGFECAACYDAESAQPTFFFHTNEGILRLNGYQPVYDDLELSLDGGYKWGALLLPDGFPSQGYYVTVDPQLPFLVFASGGDKSGVMHNYYSLDGAESWHSMDGDPPVLTPFLPLKSFMVKDQRLYVQDWKGVGASLLSPAAQNWVPDGTYFPQTGHNLFGAFRQYWDAHGGTAQLGYPITDPFSEVSQTDGKAYTVQYFERAVLELHPENAAPYNVLASLLGAEVYRQRYGEVGAAGQHPSSDNPLYFPETGYNAGGKFREYWESHGDLAQFGYPISNEFTEVSPTNGKTYVVQYFQRAEFELHSENTGTTNEVLLSQLGTEQFNVRYSVGGQPR